MESSHFLAGKIFPEYNKIIVMENVRSLPVICTLYLHDMQLFNFVFLLGVLVELPDRYIKEKAYPAQSFCPLGLFYNLKKLMPI